MAGYFYCQRVRARQSEMEGVISKLYSSAAQKWRHNAAQKRKIQFKIFIQHIQKYGHAFALNCSPRAVRVVRIGIYLLIVYKCTTFSKYCIYRYWRPQKLHVFNIYFISYYSFCISALLKLLEFPIVLKQINIKFLNSSSFTYRDRAVQTENQAHFLIISTSCQTS